MNRRNLLKSLATIPFFGTLFPKETQAEVQLDTECLEEGELTLVFVGHFNKLRQEKGKWKTGLFVSDSGEILALTGTPHIEIRKGQYFPLPTKGKPAKIIASFYVEYYCTVSYYQTTHDGVYAYDEKNELSYIFRNVPLSIRSKESFV